LEIDVPSAIQSALDRVSTAFDRLVDGLSDPARENRAALVFLLIYCSLWYVYLMIARSSTDMHPDMAEMLTWAQELSLGYPKHPPLPAYILWLWFSIFPVSEWAYTLLAVTNIGLGLYFAFRLCAVWLQGEKRAAVMLLLALIPFYNFLGSKFDQNTLLIPLWALAMWGLVRSLDSGKLGWSVLCGAAAAGAMLTKYWSLFLLLAMASTVLLDRRRGAYFKSPAPYVTAAVFLVLTMPHLIWLIQNNFPPLKWVGVRRAVQGPADWFGAFLSYSLGTVGYASVALLLWWLGTRASGSAIKDSLWPSDAIRRRAVYLFWLPMVVPVIVAIVRPTQLISLWNIPALNLLPAILLSSDKIVLPRFSVKVMAIVALGVPLALIPIAPGVAYFKLRHGAENYALYSALAGNAAAAEWHAKTSAPLQILAGPFGLVATATAYMPEHPIAYSDFSRYLAPWVTQERIDREGMAIVVPVKETSWVKQARRAAGDAPFKEVSLSRRWLWFQSAPERFMIAIVPPKADSTSGK
jgi:4-amino-4-deoxy-L-arabinose transferase-like glycosyltransferase